MNHFTTNDAIRGNRNLDLHIHDKMEDKSPKTDFNGWN